MRYPFKKSLFGYNRRQVEAFKDALDNQLVQQQEAYEARIKEVAEENIHLAVELNVARSGYKDAAELMVSAQSRVRDLERYLKEERQRVSRLDSQLMELKQEFSTATVTTLIQSMKERITALEELYDQAQKADSLLYSDGTRFEKAEFVLPEGIDATGDEPDNARGLMQRLYRLRSGESEI